MKKEKPLIFIIILFVTIAAYFIVLVPSYAYESAVARDLIRVGKEYYEKGEYAKAVHELSKALMLDPANEEAKAFLKKMGVTEGLYGRQNPPTSQIGQLSQQIVGYKQAVSYLQEEVEDKESLTQLLQEDKEYFTRALRTKEQQNEALRQKIVDFQQHQKEVQNTIKEKEAYLAKKSKEIASLNTDLYVLKGRLVDQITDSKEKDVSSHRLKKQLKMTEKQWRNNKLSYENSMRLLRKKIDESQYKTRQFDRKRKEHIVKMRDALRKMRVEASYAHNKSLMNEFKVVQREHQMVQKERKILALKESLELLDKEITYLQLKIYSQYLPEEAPAGEKLQQNAQKVEMLRKQEKLIAELKAGLALSKEKVESLSSQGLEGEKDKIDELKKQLSGMSVKLGKTKAELNEKDKSYDVLGERLEDAQERVKFIEDMMQRKDRQISEMEEQLTDILMKFE